MNINKNGVHIVYKRVNFEALKFCGAVLSGANWWKYVKCYVPYEWLIIDRLTLTSEVPGLMSTAYEWFMKNCIYDTLWLADCWLHIYDGRLIMTVMGKLVMFYILNMLCWM